MIDDDDSTVDEARRSNEDDAAFEWRREREILNDNEIGNIYENPELLKEVTNG